MEPIQWSAIVAECGNYKAGFVAVFRKYEGEATDDGTKVSQRTFADHMGIPRETFRRWVSAAGDPTWGTPEAKEARTAASHANVVKNMARYGPALLVDAIEAAGPRASDDVFHEHKLRRAGVDTSRAGRKAADAIAHHQTDPIRHAMARTDVALCVAAMEDASEHLRDAIAAGALDDDAMTKIARALEDLQITVAEARFAVSP